jgi:hypothetical protein
MRRWIKDEKGEWVEVEPDHLRGDRPFQRRRRTFPFVRWRPFTSRGRPAFT